jgi:hypothetical protein
MLREIKTVRRSSYLLTVKSFEKELKEMNSNLTSFEICKIPSKRIEFEWQTNSTFLLERKG